MIDPISVTIAISTLLMTLGHMYNSTQNDIELLRRIERLESRRITEFNPTSRRRAYRFGYY